MLIACKTDMGKVRHNNEDACLVLPPCSYISIKNKACAFAVADGMGGENCGEVASSLAVSCMNRSLSNFSKTELKPSDLEEMLAAANAEIWNYAQKHKEAENMGTTFTCLIVKEKTVMVGHIGDSRLYRRRKGDLERITTDHSMVTEQLEKGRMTQEEAFTHPMRHVLSRCLGVRQFVKPDIFELDLVAGDEFVLCTDGAYCMLAPENFEKILLKEDLKDLPEEVINAANNAGGKDNSTVLAVRVETAPFSFPGRWSFERLSQFLNYRNINGYH